MINEKRGISHVEVILSFVIFLGFLIFLLAIFNPFKIVGGGEVYLNVLEREIIKNVSVEVDFLTLKLGDDVKKCFGFGYDYSNNVIVKNESQNFVNAFTITEVGKENIFEKKIYLENKGSFFYIQFSKEFEESNFPYGDCISIEEEKDYNLGLFRSYDMTSNKSLIELHKNLIENYVIVKEKFGVPVSKEFSVSVRDMDEKIIFNATKEAPKKVGVLARDVPIQIIYRDGNIKYAKLNIQVW